MNDPLAERKRLTFEQAHAGAPLPAQLKTREISEEFRAVLWAYIYEELKDSEVRGSEGSHLGDRWDTILRDEWIYRAHNAADEYPWRFPKIVERVKAQILGANWSSLLGWLEFVLKHPSRPDNFANQIDHYMQSCRLAYRVFDSIVICPICSEADRQTIEGAFADLAASEFHGARKHLSDAAGKLTAGDDAGSIRESIQAVESVIRVLEPDGDFSKALAKLEAKTKIHGALKAGFNSIYGFTSDAQGIRHALLDKASADVDETDALFMIGACAAFVSYLINKARTAGLLRPAR